MDMQFFWGFVLILGFFLLWLAVTADTQDLAKRIDQLREDIRRGSLRGTTATVATVLSERNATGLWPPAPRPMTEPFVDGNRGRPRRTADGNGLGLGGRSPDGIPSLLVAPALALGSTRCGLRRVRPAPGAPGAGRCRYGSRVTRRQGCQPESRSATRPIHSVTEERCTSNSRGSRT